MSSRGLLDILFANFYGTEVTIYCHVREKNNENKKKMQSSLTQYYDYNTSCGVEINSAQWLPDLMKFQKEFIARDELVTSVLSHVARQQNLMAISRFYGLLARC